MAAQVTSKRNADADCTNHASDDGRRAAEVLADEAPMRLSVVATLSAVRREGQSVRQPPLVAGSSTPTRRTSASARRRGLDLGPPARPVDHDREERRGAGDHHLRDRVRHAEPGIEDRRVAMIGIALAATSEGHNGVAGIRPARDAERDHHAHERADHEPTDSFDQGRLGGREQRPSPGAPVLHECGGDRRWSGEMKRGRLRSRMRSSQIAMPPTKTTTAAGSDAPSSLTTRAPLAAAVAPEHRPAAAAAVTRSRPRGHALLGASGGSPPRPHRRAAPRAPRSRHGSSVDPHASPRCAGAARHVAQGG